MRTLLILFVLISSLTSNVIGQVTFGVKLTQPFGINPATSHIYANTQGVNEFKFNARSSTYSPRFGLVTRLQKGNIWFGLEAMVGKNAKEYTREYTLTNSLEDRASPLREERIYLNFPISLGVRLGMVDVFSGISPGWDLSYKSNFAEMDDYTYTKPDWGLGWHCGIGLQYGRFLADIRYEQNFANYGTGHIVCGEELLLYNAPTAVSLNLVFLIIQN